MFKTAVLLWFAITIVPDTPPDGWKQLAPGMDYTNITANEQENI
jgi:hypothetical protein